MRSVEKYLWQIGIEALKLWISWRNGDMKYGMLEAPKVRFFIHFQLDISFGIPFFSMVLHPKWTYQIALREYAKET